MAKKPFPLLKRINVALGETSSMHQRNVVYHLLTETLEKFVPDEDKFYSNINHKTLSPIYNNDVRFSLRKTNLGLEIEYYLNSNLVLPEPRIKNYIEKMREVRSKEFKILKNYLMKKNE